MKRHMLCNNIKIDINNDELLETILEHTKEMEGRGYYSFDKFSSTLP
jgi:serine protease inhibitor ecotin